MKIAPKKLQVFIFVFLLVAIFLYIFFFQTIKNKNDQMSSSKIVPPVITISPQEVAAQERQSILKTAAKHAASYNYDSSISIIDSYPEAATYPELAQARQIYSEQKDKLVEQDITQIPHIFFHSLIADTSRAFDGDREQDGYNQYMTTIDEFNKIMQQMYDRGYVLVSMHDMALKVTQPDGTVVMQKGSILLPPGKKAFVLSVDDVNYYQYMLDDGFASKIVLDEKGQLVNELVQADGSITLGAFDVVPLLNQFIETHPDFSYQGSKGILAITGYEGVLGYRTCPTDDKNGYMQEDIAKAKAVADALKADGWEFASHTWGHKHMGQISLDRLKEDTDRWKEEVEPILGETDIIIYPYGEDIEEVKKYNYSNLKFSYLKQAGFDYFCNVDSHPAWVQLNTEYLRQGRRNLDGYRMYYDLIDNGVDRLSDLFQVAEVFDPTRPTPVKPIGKNSAK